MYPKAIQAQIEALAGLDRPAGFELGTLTKYDIPDLATLFLSAYDPLDRVDSHDEAVAEIRLLFSGEFGTPVDNCQIGAWQDGKLVGAVFTVTDPPWDDLASGPFITDMFVSPQSRGRGIATALIGEVALRCAALGFENISLRVDLNQAPDAARLYDFLGFS